MNCDRCDQPVTRDDEHYKDVRDDYDFPILECSGWTCEMKDWRAEVARLRSIIKNLIDFDIGEDPEKLCAADGPRQRRNAEQAWADAVAEVGRRDNHRFMNVTLESK